MRNYAEYLSVRLFLWSYPKLHWHRPSWRNLACALDSHNLSRYLFDEFFNAIIGLTLNGCRAEPFTIVNAVHNFVNAVHNLAKIVNGSARIFGKIFFFLRFFKNLYFRFKTITLVRYSLLNMNFRNFCHFEAKHTKKSKDLACSTLSLCLLSRAILTMKHRWVRGPALTRAKNCTKC